MVSVVYVQDADRDLETECFSGLSSTPSGDYHGLRRSSEVIPPLSFPPTDVQDCEFGTFARFPAGSGAPCASRERRGAAADALAPRSRPAPSVTRRHCVALVSPDTSISALRASGFRSPPPGRRQATQTLHRATSGDSRTPGPRASHSASGMSGCCFLLYPDRRWAIFLTLSGVGFPALRGECGKEPERGRGCGGFAPWVERP